MSDSGGTRLTVDDNDLLPRAPAQNPLAPYGYEDPQAGYQPPLGPDERDRWFWQMGPDRPYASGLPKIAEKAQRPMWADVERRLADYAIRTAKGIVQAGPGTVNALMTGELQPGTDAAAQAAANTALTYGALGTVVPRPYGSLGMFGGIRSQTAPRMGNLPPEGSGLKTVEAAQRMEAGQWPFNRTYDRDEIFDATGWFKTPDNEWKYIISDKGAALNLGNMEIQRVFNNATGRNDVLVGLDYGKTYKLPEILKHDDLYQAYPWMKDIEVEAMDPSLIGGNVAGSYNHEKNKLTIEMSNKNELLSTVLHELQHAVQKREGFGYGGDPAEFLPPTWGQEWLKNSEELKTLQNEFFSMGPGQTHTASGMSLEDVLRQTNALEARQARLYREYEKAMKDYYNLAGEAESRATEGMLWMRQWDRPPWEVGEYFSTKGGGGYMDRYTPFGMQIIKKEPPTAPKIKLDEPASTHLSLDETPTPEARSERIIKLDDVKAQRAAAEEEAKRAQVRKGLEEMRERLLPKPSYPLPQQVKDALHYFDDLGFETKGEAIRAIREQGKNWQFDFDMRPQHEFMPQMDDLARHKDALTHKRHIDVLNKYLSRPAGGWPEGTKF